MRGGRDSNPHPANFRDLPLGQLSFRPEVVIPSTRDDHDLSMVTHKFESRGQVASRSSKQMKGSGRVILMYPFTDFLGSLGRIMTTRG